MKKRSFDPDQEPQAMRIYRLQTRDNEMGTAVSFYWNKAEAEKERRKFMSDADDHESAEIEAIDFEPTKAGIMRFLHIYTPHMDNG